METLSDRKSHCYHLIVGWVTGSSSHLGLPLAGLLGVREEVQLDIGVWICAVLHAGLDKSTNTSLQHNNTGSNNAFFYTVTGFS